MAKYGSYLEMDRHYTAESGHAITVITPDGAETDPEDRQSARSRVEEIATETLGGRCPRAIGSNCCTEVVSVSLTNGSGNLDVYALKCSSEGQCPMGLPEVNPEAP